MSSTEDRVANKVLQECSQEFVDDIKVDLVILRLHSKGWLTTQELRRIEESLPALTTQEKTKKLYLALADKGLAAFEDIISILNDTAVDHRPHADLADKLSQRYRRCLSSQHSHSDRHGRTQDDNNDVDHRVDHLDSSEHCHSDDESQLLLNAAASSSSPRSSVTQQLPLPFQNTSDPTVRRLPSSTHGPGRINAGRQPVEVDQPILIANTVIRETRFNDSSAFTSSNSTGLIKSLTPLRDMIDIKMITVGDSGVGKTSLVQRYTYGIYQDHTLITIGSKHDECYFHHVQKGINIRLCIWDTAGTEKFNAVSSSYYRKAHVAMVVFDMSQPNPLNSVSYWKSEISKYSDNSNIPVLLVGNKCDISGGSDELRAYAQWINENFKDFIKASAKRNIGVGSIFEKAISLVLEHGMPPECVTSSVDRQQQRKKCPCN